MFSWLKREEVAQEVVETALGEMKKIYKSKLLPLEEFYNFHDFHRFVHMMNHISSECVLNYQYLIARSQSQAGRPRL